MYAPTCFLTTTEESYSFNFSDFKAEIMIYTICQLINEYASELKVVVYAEQKS